MRIFQEKNTPAPQTTGMSPGVASKAQAVHSRHAATALQGNTCSESSSEFAGLSRSWGLEWPWLNQDTEGKKNLSKPWPHSFMEAAVQGMKGEL